MCSCWCITRVTHVTRAVTQSYNLDEIKGQRCIWIWLALFGIEIQFHAPVFVPKRHKFSNSNSISMKNYFGWCFEIQVGSQTGPKYSTLHLWKWYFSGLRNRSLSSKCLRTMDTVIFFLSYHHVHCDNYLSPAQVDLSLFTPPLGQPPWGVSHGYRPSPIDSGTQTQGDRSWACQPFCLRHPQHLPLSLVPFQGQPLG